MYNILLDTNVLLDYYIGEEEHARTCADLLEMLDSGGHGILVPLTALKDEYYLIARRLKDACLQEKGSVSQADVDSAQRIAWSCVKHTMQIAQVADMGYGDTLRARTLQSIHADFEDNLIVAAGERCKVDYLVTSDKRLLRHSTIPTLAPAELLALLKAESNEPDTTT